MNEPTKEDKIRLLRQFIDQILFEFTVHSVFSNSFKFRRHQPERADSSVQLRITFPDRPDRITSKAVS